VPEVVRYLVMKMMLDWEVDEMGWSYASSSFGAQYATPAPVYPQQVYDRYSAKRHASMVSEVNNGFIAKPRPQRSGPSFGGEK